MFLNGSYYNIFIIIIVNIKKLTTTKLDFNYQDSFIKNNIQAFINK